MLNRLVGRNSSAPPPEVWLPAIAAAELAPLTFHDLRHTHASLLIAQGEHPKVISERLSHSSIAVTFDVYGHLMPGLDEEVAERLDQAWLQAIGSETRTVRAPGKVVELPEVHGTPPEQGFRGWALLGSNQ